MSKLLKAVEGFIYAGYNGTLYPNAMFEYSDSFFDVTGVRSNCNTHWASIKITPRREPALNAKTAMRDAFTHVNALIDNEDARLIMMTAIKRVYDAATK